MDEQETKNVFSIVKGAKPEPEVPAVEVADTYAIVTRNPFNGDEETLTASGFLVFTSQHVAVMQERGDASVPILVVPLQHVSHAGLVDPDAVREELPF